MEKLNPRNHCYLDSIFDMKGLLRCLSRALCMIVARILFLSFDWEIPAALAIFEMRQLPSHS